MHNYVILVQSNSIPDTKTYQLQCITFINSIYHLCIVNQTTFQNLILQPSCKLWGFNPQFNK